MGSRGKKSKKDVTEIGVTMASSKGKKKKMDGEDKEVSATVDLDVFDCPICFEPLHPPLFQCQNGHVACPSCCKKLQDKCPSCGQSTNHSRCLALEKVIESFKVPCSYATDGCKEIISYAKQLEHRDRCMYFPFVCPMPNCSVSLPTTLLPTHVEEVHRQLPLLVRKYDYPQRVSVRRDSPFHVVVGPDGDVFLLIIQKVSLGAWNGNSLSVVCIRPQASEAKFKYELLYSNEKRSFELKAPVTNVKEWKGCHPTDTFLLLPKDQYPTLIFFILIIRKV